MDTNHHGFSDLFAQLGLASDDASIRNFIASHAPLPGNLRLDEASFWTPAQKQLLRESLSADADWAEVVDRLSAALRST